MIIDNDETRQMIDEFFSHNFDLRLNDTDIDSVFDFMNELPVYEKQHNCPVTGVTDQGFNL
jgi:hypothetical protein